MNGFAPYLRRHLAQWALSFLAALGAVASTLFIPRLLGWTIDDLRRTDAPGAHLPLYAGGIVIAAAASSLLYVVMRRSASTASREVSFEVRRDVFARLTALEPAYYQETRTGDLMNRLTGDLAAVQEMLGFALTQAVNTAFILVLTLSFMLRLSWQLGGVVLCVFPLMIGLLMLMLRTIARRYVLSQEELSRITARAQENFSGMRVVKGYAIEAREEAEYLTLNRSYRGQVLRLAQVQGSLGATVSLMMNTVFVAVLYLGARQILRAGDGARLGGLSLGAFVTFTTYLFQLSWPMLSIGVVVNVFQRGIVSWGRLQQLLEAPVGIADGAQTDPSIHALQGEIRFEHVTLKLGGRTLLDDVSLEVPAGQTLGITGRTGSGKTLLTSLVARLLEPTSGIVRVDGHDVRSIPLAVLRAHLGVVPQEPFLFSDTLAENIGFGLPERMDSEGDAPLDRERIRWAASVAGVAEDIEGFADGYDTRIGERGVTLSGGQRQRTALARAIARRPRVLVLDDAMSAVDTETESRILSQLKQVLEGRTVFLIGHRVSTLRHADHIVVLDQGRVVEQGTHDALLVAGGAYAALEERQRLAQALEADDEAARVPAA